MNADGSGTDPPTREDVAAMAPPALRELLATTHVSEVAAWAIQELPVVPDAGGRDATIEDVCRVVKRLDEPPYLAVAQYLRRVEEPARLVNHPNLLRAALRDGPIHDDNYVHDVTTPLDILGHQDHLAAGAFVDDLVAALDREPRGHEGATSILETIRRVQFTERDVPRDDHGRPEEAISAHTAPLSEQADSVAEHADSIAAVLARQHASELAQTSRTARTALVVLHGIGRTDPTAVADDRILQQIVRALRQFTPSSQAFREARSVLVTVGQAQPDQVQVHIDPVVAGVAAELRTADPNPDSGRTSRETAAARLVLVRDLLRTHPEATVEAAGWAGLVSAFAEAGPATRKVGGALLTAAENIDRPRAVALVLNLVAVAAEESPEAFAAHTDRVDAIVDDTVSSDTHERDQRLHVRIQSAAEAVYRAVEGCNQ